MRGQIRIAAAVSLVAKVFFIGGLHAPAASAAEGASGIEEVVVTARKREESLQDAPISIAAFTGADLEARGLTDLNELAPFTPNMTFDFADANSGNNNSSIIHIRGIGTSDWTMTVDPGVGLYVDGVYISRAVGGVLDLLDFERIEVLRGPQGTLFGKNTIGGAINITTRKPSYDELFGKAEVTVGSYDRVDFRGSINVPLGETLAATAAFSTKTRDGYVKALEPGATDFGDDGSMAARVAFRWEPTDSLVFDMSFDYTRERERPAANVTMEINDNPPTLAWLYNAFFSGDPSCADTTNPARFSNPLCYNNQWIPDDPYKTWKVFIDLPTLTEPLGQPIKPESNLDLWGVGLNAEWTINEYLTAKAITAFRKAENGYWSRTLAAPDIPFGQTVSTWDQDQFSAELQLLGSSFEDRLNWILGLYTLEEDGCWLDVALITGIVLHTYNCVENSSAAAFGQATWAITEQFDITVGLRYTDEDKNYLPDNYVYADLGLGVPVGTRLVPYEWANTQSEETTPYVNLAYRWNEEVMTYLSYSEGFKAGGFTHRVFPPRPATPTFQPEFAKVYEAGFKSTVLENRMRLNGAVFFTDYTDMQINVAAATVGDGDVGDVGVITANAAEAEIYGGELELVAVPAERWQIDAGLGYLHASYNEIDPAAVAIETSNKLVNAPEWSYTVGLTYTHLLQGGSLEPRVYYSYTSKVYNTPENDALLIQDGFGLLNAMLTWTDSRDAWSVTLQGHNLTDETYIVDGVNDAGNGFIDGTFGMPRTWALTVRRRF